jgi:hypothetical protein
LTFGQPVRQHTVMRKPRCFLLAAVVITAVGVVTWQSLRLYAYGPTVGIVKWTIEFTQTEEKT